MELFTLSYGKSKSKMKPIMIDAISSINFYLKSRGGLSGRGGRMGSGWFKVEVAAKGATQWRRKSATIGGNKCTGVPHINRHGTTIRNGYIDKNGFNQHT